LGVGSSYYYYKSLQEQLVQVQRNVPAAAYNDNTFGRLRKEFADKQTDNKRQIARERRDE
jgi:hypothetical protein